MQTSASRSFKCKEMKGAHTMSLTEHWQHVAVDVYNFKTNANSNTHQLMYNFHFSQQIKLQRFGV